MEPMETALLSSLVVHVRPENIRSLILEKEKELKDIHAYRIRTLKTLLRDKETAASAATQDQNKLKEDLAYNLKLLGRQKDELARNDATFASLKSDLRDRETELKEFQVRDTMLQIELQRAKEDRHEMEIQYEQRLTETRAQVEDEMKDQQDAMETQRLKLETKLKEKEEEAERQRRALIATFDDVRRQSEMKFKRESDELQTKVREVERENKELVKHTNAQCARADKLKTKHDNLEQVIQAKDKEMQSLKWTLADVNAAKKANVGEVESEVAKLIEVKQQLRDEYESKMAELLQLLHPVEKAFRQQKTQHDEELRCLLEQKKIDMQEARTRSEAKIKTLTVRLYDSEEKVEALQAELTYAKWDADDRLMGAEREIRRVRSVVQNLEDEQHCVTNKLQQRLRVGSREVRSLQERLQESAREIALLKEKDKAQRQEHLECVEKQEDLQRELVAVNMRWENRLQEQQQKLNERHLRELRERGDCLLNEKQAVEERVLHAKNEVQRLRSELVPLKPSARISDSLDSQYVASATKMSFEAAPLFGDDPDTLSPVPHRTECPLLRPNTTARTSANGLATENLKLRELIRQMKASTDPLTQHAEEMEALPGQAGGSQSASKLSTELLEALERYLVLETQLDKNCSPDRSVALQFESCRRELSEAQQSVETKSRQIVKLESRIQELERLRVAEPRLQSRHAALEAQLRNLNQKLEAAHSNIEHLVRERSQLMELSNQLRADLRESKSPTLRVEFAGKKDYQNLVAELMQARIHNKTLKKELRRMEKLQVQFQQEQDSSSVGLQVRQTQRDRRRRAGTGLANYPTKSGVCTEFGTIQRTKVNV